MFATNGHGHDSGHSQPCCVSLTDWQAVDAVEAWLAGSLRFFVFCFSLLFPFARPPAHAMLPVCRSDPSFLPACIECSPRLTQIDADWCRLVEIGGDLLRFMEIDRDELCRGTMR